MQTKPFFSRLLTNPPGAGLATYGDWINSEANAQGLVCRLLRTAVSKEQISDETRFVLAKLFHDVKSRDGGSGDLGSQLFSAWFLDKLAGGGTWNIRQLLLDPMREAPVSLAKVAKTHGTDKFLEILEHVRNYYRTCLLSPKNVLEAASIELGEWVTRPAVPNETAACPVERVLLAQMTLERRCTKNKVKRVQQIYPSMSVEAMVQGMYEGKEGMKFARLVELLGQPEFKKYRRQVKSLTSRRKFKHSIDEAARKQFHPSLVQQIRSYF